MKLVVTDVSVFFDLYKIQALPEFFALDWEIYTTDFVYNEILHANQKSEFEVFARSKQLKILKLSNEEVSEVLNFKTSLKIHSLADKTILWKALRLEATLLTCDSKLRKVAEGHAIEVRGSIWVIEQLIINKIIDAGKGISLFEELKVKNTRLPVETIDKLIKQWEK
jgi:rRNA maturation endonuclease Nob1